MRRTPSPTTAPLLCLALALGATACAPPPAPAVSPPPPALEPVAPAPVPAEAPAPLSPLPPLPHRHLLPPPEPPPDPTLIEDISVSPRPSFEPGAVFLRKGDWRSARKLLREGLAKLGGQAPLDAQMVGRALIARTCAALKDEVCVAADTAYLVTMWGDGVEGQKQLQQLGGDEAAQRRRVARAVAAVGEALFLEAEQERVAADRLTPPVYRGKGEQKEVFAFVKAKVGPWVGAKRLAIEAAEKAYVKVLEVRPAPPPRWVVASGERVGAMWSGFVDALRASPMPAVWQTEGTVPGNDTLRYHDLRDTYVSQLEQSSEPQLDRARSAYEKCSQLAARFHVTDERSRACNAWIASHPAKPVKPAQP